MKERTAYDVWRAGVFGRVLFRSRGKGRRVVDRLAADEERLRRTEVDPAIGRPAGVVQPHGDGRGSTGVRGRRDGQRAIRREIGRAPCRGRGEISVGAVSLKKKIV